MYRDTIQDFSPSYVLSFLTCEVSSECRCLKMFSHSVSVEDDNKALIHACM